MSSSRPFAPSQRLHTSPPTHTLTLPSRLGTTPSCPPSEVGSTSGKTYISRGRSLWGSQVWNKCEQVWKGAFVDLFVDRDATYHHCLFNLGLGALHHQAEPHILSAAICSTHVCPHLFVKRASSLLSGMGTGKPKDLAKRAILLSGPPGIGKTSASHIIARCGLGGEAGGRGRIDCIHKSSQRVDGDGHSSAHTPRSLPHLMYRSLTPPSLCPQGVRV